MIESSHKEFLDALLVGNRSKCSEIVGNLFNKNIPVPIEDIYESVIKKTLYVIGEMWESGKISVATEHLASAIVEAILNELYIKVISTKRINKTAVVSCVEQEYHQVGIKMVADVFEINGWNAFFLGANTPANELVKFITEIQPDVVALSLSIYANLLNLETMLEAIRKEFPTLIIIVGGQAFRHGGREVLIKYQNVIYLADLYGVESFLKSSILSH